MTPRREKNPYEVLRLGTRASIREVIERSRDLASETMDEKLQAEYRWAAEEIRQHPVRRARNQFWEPPNSCYDDPVLDAFCLRYEGVPFTRASTQPRARQFAEEDCSGRRLADLARPPLPKPPYQIPPLDHGPQETIELPLDPREILL